MERRGFWRGYRERIRSRGRWFSENLRGVGLRLLGCLSVIETWDYGRRWEKFYPQAQEQLCWDHKMLNVIDAVSKKSRSRSRGKGNAILLHARHTFITEQVKRGELLKAIAGCGTSVVMIEQDYCGTLTLSDRALDQTAVEPAASKFAALLASPTGFEPVRLKKSKKGKV
jgi:hypothetical protein